MKQICKTCTWSRVKPKNMKENEGCKGCKHNFGTKKSMCSSCGHIIETSVHSGIESHHKRAEWADFEKELWHPIAILQNQQEFNLGE